MAVTNDALNGEEPKIPKKECVCSANGQKTLTDQFAELIRMHQEILNLTAGLMEQNNQLLQANSEMVSMLAPLMDDIEDEPTHYMDGTRIKN